MYNEYITPTATEPLECATIVHAATENKEMNMINMDSKREYTKLSFFCVRMNCKKSIFIPYILNKNKQKGEKIYEKQF